jgi:hypothetical protein
VTQKAKNTGWPSDRGKGHVLETPFGDERTGTQNAAQRFKGEVVMGERPTVAVRHGLRHRRMARRSVRVGAGAEAPWMVAT